VNDLPPRGANERTIIDAIRQLIQGRNNATGSLTLTASVTTTTVTKATLNSGGVPILVPRTSNAAAEQAAGTMYVSATAGGSFTLTHANNAQTDRTFDYVSLGG